MNRIIKKIKAELESAGIQINGTRPWDVQVKDDRLFEQVVRKGSLGLGEAYMDGWWEAEALDKFFTRVLEAKLEEQFTLKPAYIFEYIKSVITNPQNREKAFEIGDRHYDIGNDLYKIMLDKRMVYTCGYWQKAEMLDEAQQAKLELVCRKIGLQSGQRVLDIGCGWGSFAQYAAEEYGAEVVGITVSKEQVELGRERCKGLPVEIRLQDYREVNEPFDHIVSLGMIEHVGTKNYRTYMETVHRCLDDEGVFLLHTIGSNQSVRTTDPWIEKYIFPNSLLPSIRQLSRAAEGLFVMEDWQNFGAYYDKTLMAWYQNFDAGWDELKSTYSERFYRMWKYYLLSSAGSFRARKNQLWQIVFSKQGIPGGFVPPRYQSKG
ncbi:MAG: cyclopropane fatty acyl phospholipid synthase [Candidatus Halalkalibacterium sp. M3_1C_030]